MDRTFQRARAERFLALHHAQRPLVLVNVWDVASALVVQGPSFGLPVPPTALTLSRDGNSGSAAETVISLARAEMQKNRRLDTIAAITAQPVEWIVPAGSVP